MFNDLNQMLVMVPIFIVSISLHEFGHAAAGHFCGDDTAEKAGRLTINPLAHLDVFGTLMLVFVGFGWAKPVPFDPRNLKHPRWQAPLIAAAGPFVNFLLLLVSLIGYKLAGSWSPFAQAWQMGIIVNAMLVVFNLIPIPPLDGSLILREVLPKAALPSYDNMATYGSLILLLFIYLPLTRSMLTSVQIALVQGVSQLIPL